MMYMADGGTGGEAEYRMEGEEKKDEDEGFNLLCL